MLSMSARCASMSSSPCAPKAMAFSDPNSMTSGRLPAAAAAESWAGTSGSATGTTLTVTCGLSAMKVSAIRRIVACRSD